MQAPSSTRCPPIHSLSLPRTRRETLANIDPIEIVFHEKSLTGFFLGNWLRDCGFVRLMRTVSKVQRLLIDRRIETVIQRRLTFDEVVDGLLHYTTHMTDGKVLILPQRK